MSVSGILSQSGEVRYALHLLRLHTGGYYSELVRKVYGSVRRLEFCVADEEPR